MLRDILPETRPFEKNDVFFESGSNSSAVVKFF